MKIKINCRIIALDSIQAKFGLPKVELSGTSIAQICPPNPIMDCVTGKYRAYAGYCNNVEHEMWGAAFEPFYRYGTPDYADGKQE